MFICSNGFPRLTSVDQVRKVMFKRKFDKEGNTLDLSVLPPCVSNLLLHTKRDHYVTNVDNRANRLSMRLDDPWHQGWVENCAQVWVEIAFPEDLIDLLLDEENEVDDMDEYLSFSHSDSDSRGVAREILMVG